MICLISVNCAFIVKEFYLYTCFKNAKLPEKQKRGSNSAFFRPSAMRTGGNIDIMQALTTLKK